MGNADNVLFDNDSRVAPLGLIAMAGASELGKKVDGYLTKWANENEFVKDTFLVEAVCPRFSSGDGKGLIKSSIRGDDLFILCDVGNYSCTYNYFGRENSMSPDDHYQDLKRIIQAAGGKAHRINIIMPSLYGGRQHRRNYRESLDCAVALQELAKFCYSRFICYIPVFPLCIWVAILGRHAKAIYIAEIKFCDTIIVHRSFTLFSAFTEHNRAVCRRWGGTAFCGISAGCHYSYS